MDTDTTEYTVILTLQGSCVIPTQIKYDEELVRLWARCEGAELLLRCAIRKITMLVTESGSYLAHKSKKFCLLILGHLLIAYPPNSTKLFLYKCFLPYH